MSDVSDASETAGGTATVRLRRVEPADLELFHAFEQDEEAVRRSRVPRARAGDLREALDHEDPR